MADETIGTCASCKKKFPAKDMAKHVAACERRPTGDADGFLIAVSASEQPGHWMLVETQAHATLDDLDQFLRQAWLECCGHLSSFKIAKKTYTSSNADLDGDEEALDMYQGLSDLLKPRSKFSYEYDFGSTTTLIFQVEGRLKVKPSVKPVRLLALNDPFTPVCEKCEQPAKRLCACCGGMPLCKVCIKEHECGDEGVAPILNSPRAGMCGYEGPPIKI